ncbi:T9SS type A sorting domain-containing protein [Rosettibacter firmus]|uniref:T9SS type A sorting domain-containing protein n=1 Tax=Rosettibacter firmus TaxID=3111522 RepID=UPI00336BDCC9
MTRKILSTIFFILLAINFSFSQNPEWVNFNAGHYINALAFEGDYIWVGTTGGLFNVNMFTGEKVYYIKTNSGLPDNWVYAIAIDSEGNKWIGTGGGLAVYREGGVILDVNEKEENPVSKKFSLYQNYPNPFNPATVIEFDIPEITNVKLEVYDILGRKVKTILDERLEVGRYRVKFDGGDLSSGVYFYVLLTNKFSSVKKMVLVK